MLKVLDLLRIPQFNFARCNSQLIVYPVGRIPASVEAKEFAGRANFEILRQWSLIDKFLEELVLLRYQLWSYINILGVEGKNKLGTCAVEIVHKFDFMLSLR